MFDRVWKDQIQKPKGKLGIWKPKEELKPREEPDKRTNCKEKLIKIAEFWEEYKRDIKRMESGRGGTVKTSVDLHIALNDVPEEICCKFIEFIKPNFKENGGHRTVQLSQNYIGSYGIFETLVMNTRLMYLDIDEVFGSVYRIHIDLSSNNIEESRIRAESIIAYIQKQFGE